MPNFTVAPYTLHGFTAAPSKVYLLDDVPVAVTAIGLGYVAVKLRGLNGLVEIARGKRKRMVVPVACLCVVFWNQSVRGMAIVASCHGMMAALGPSVEMVLHNMAIRTDTRLVAQVRDTFGINKGVRADTQAASYHGRKYHDA